MNNTEKWIIETRGLTRIYGDGEAIRALDDVTMQVASGELVAVMGPSGSGKSTLLNMIGALDMPTQGQVIVNGQDLATIANKDQFRARAVGFVFQLHNLIPTLTAVENVEVPMNVIQKDGKLQAVQTSATLSVGLPAEFKVRSGK